MIQKLTNYIYEAEEKQKSRVVLLDYDKMKLDKYKKTFIETFVDMTNDVILSLEKAVKQIQTNVIEYDGAGFSNISSTMGSVSKDLQNQIDSIVSVLHSDIQKSVGFDINTVLKNKGE